ncbi:hypothetical protein GCM10010399_83500 [Dactylosporangium fulvum]|uniref:Uncharacterized protein n=1 Tax=Dactylosporangium fulvum TaxID=53359 RepID=A0ABY5WD03_9ACTN|nr:hypothetical protein [Dactylosporangium fulvum]UWP86096.1 hypothetical protein Dfulv_18365 [Dactylosporangium fulvum]
MPAIDPITDSVTDPITGTTGTARRRTLIAAAGAALAAPLVRGPGPAAAAVPWQPARHPARVRVDVRDDRVVLTPARVPGGLVELEVTTTVAAGASAGLLRLHDGVDVDAYLRNYADAYSPDPEVSHRAILLNDRQADYLGGATVTAVTPVRTGAYLAPGRYRVFNYPSIRTPYAAASMATLDVTSDRPVPAPAAAARVVMHGRGPSSGYLAPDRLPARGRWRVTNLTAQLNELTLLPLGPGVTAVDVAAFFAALRDGRTPPDGVVTGQPRGLAPLSPGRCGDLVADLPAGRYALASFMYDRGTWVKGALQGFWKLVTLY